MSTETKKPPKPPVIKHNWRNTNVLGELKVVCANCKETFSISMPEKSKTSCSRKPMRGRLK